MQFFGRAYELERQEPQLFVRAAVHGRAAVVEDPLQGGGVRAAHDEERPGRLPLRIPKVLEPTPKVGLLPVQALALVHDDDGGIVPGELHGGPEDFKGRFAERARGEPERPAEDARPKGGDPPGGGTFRDEEVNVPDAVPPAEGLVQKRGLADAAPSRQCDEARFALPDDRRP